MASYGVSTLEIHMHEQLVALFYFITQTCMQSEEMMIELAQFSITALELTVQGDTDTLDSYINEVLN